VKLETILLGVLLEHPRTGYDLKKYLDTHGRFLRSNTQMSQVYRSLGRMEQDGWVTHTVHPRPGAQDAKTYRVTEDGAAVFLDWLTGPYQPPSRFQDPDLGVRLAFAGFLTVDQLLHLIDVELGTRRDEISRFRFRDREMQVDGDIDFDHEMAAGVAEWGHATGAAAMDAHVAALEDLRRRLLDAQIPSRASRGDIADPAATRTAPAPQLGSLS
jgi:DNA-binding PadR family transcriptional regulator